MNEFKTVSSRRFILQTACTICDLLGDEHDNCCRISQQIPMNKHIFFYIFHS